MLVSEHCAYLTSELVMKYNDKQPCYICPKPDYLVKQSRLNSTRTCKVKSWSLPPLERCLYVSFSRVFNVIFLGVVSLYFSQDCHIHAFPSACCFGVWLLPLLAAVIKLIVSCHSYLFSHLGRSERTALKGLWQMMIFLSQAHEF